MAGDENLRIGDAERDEAITLLREHMSAGRITAEEFDERIDRENQGRTCCLVQRPSRTWAKHHVRSTRVRDLALTNSTPAHHCGAPGTTFLVDHVRCMGRSDSGMYHTHPLLGRILGSHALVEPRIQQEDDQIS